MLPSPVDAQSAVPGVSPLPAVAATAMGLEGPDDLLTLLLEGVEDLALLAFDGAQKLTFWNPAAPWLLRRDLHAGLAAEELFLPREATTGLSLRPAGPDQPQSTTVERWLRRGDGTCFRACLTITSRCRGAEPPHGYSVAFRESVPPHESTSAETARLREEGFRELANAAPTILWVTDAEGRCHFLSQSWQTFTGQMEADGLGLGWVEMVHPDDRASAAHIFLEANARREPFRLDYRVRRADGEYRWAIDAGQPRFSPEGQYLGFVGTVFDIHQRKLAEEKATRLIAEAGQSRRLQESILSTSPDLMYVFGLDHRFTYANQALLNMWGRTWEEAIGRNCLELGYEPWHAAMHDREIDQVAATRQPIRGEVPFTGTNGRRIYDYILVPVLDAEGQVAAVAGSTRDVTERQRAEAVLEGQKTVLEKIAHGDALSSILYSLTRLVEELTDGASHACVQLLDGENRLREGACASLPEAFRRGFDGVPIGPNAASCGTAAWRKETVVAREIATDPLWAEYRELALANGLQSCWSVPIFSHEGAVLGTFAVYHSAPHVPSTRERGLAEVLAQTAGLAIERKRAEEDRQHSEENARFLARASAELAGLNDPQSTLQKLASIAVPAFADWCLVDLALPDGCLERLATTSAATLGQDGLAGSHQESGAPALASRVGARHVLRAGTSIWYQNVTPEHLAALTAEDDQPYSLELLGLRSYIGVPMRRRGQTIGVLTFLTADSGRRYGEADRQAAEDLAQRAAVAMENAALYHEVREGDRRKDEFLATLAHELRNPLAPIRNALQLLSETENDPTTFAETRTLMERQLAQLVHLVDDLLDVSRITRGAIELRRRRVTLAEVVRSAVEISQPHIRAAGQTLEVRLESVDLTLEADPVRLAQVISNLLNNSARYSGVGGRIMLELRSEGAELLVRVSDDGIGIAPEMLPRVFEMFTQADRSLERSKGGLGIGLTLVKRLVEQHGGTVQAHSAGLGLGSEFTVRLPLPAIVAPPADGRPTSPIAAAALPASLRRILVVDDNRDAAHTLGKLLTRAGHTVRTAFDGLEAMDLVSTFRPEVVLLDIGLPGLNGYEVAARIRAGQHAPQPVLIALTGWGQEEDRRRGREAGFDFHLVKPVDYPQLKTLLQSLPGPSPGAPASVKV